MAKINLFPLERTLLEYGIKIADYSPFHTRPKITLTLTPSNAHYPKIKGIAIWFNITPNGISNEELLEWLKPLLHKAE